MTGSSTSSTPPARKNRCLFWPCCSKKDCPFVHPNTFCNNWLNTGNCLKGNQCYFIHPCCPLDMNCPEVQCPKLHSNPFARLQLIKENMRKAAEPCEGRKKRWRKVAV
eukprot:Blabericola_migrator_1__7304@NODE_3715_length_1559_cov_108_977212_g2305_i0_p2_GENE_NODE_3715_length_1559_cov_108_977212_g2305_i0NODE_3715_length_1559_cov_108_977212_g2305_i0_p2_ORF_typecomplete_len108_score1_08zfCCCH/PF00642_24/1_1e04zfCCCH/PF00642_24/1_5e02zfCCCH/PF00642_24/3_2e05zf_CCCH_4/PF18345_1/1_3e04zf_CCCH_4/PF18345_1/1_2e02zf_CCCH_4/PF18345_1/0_00021zfCCCH_4/PF18044_1/0_0045zfCCCH_4/PF18044_1/3e03zfCCCH_2/PF14608_6/3_3e03zfCCCH_2/PF14608_6/1_1zfCCCH_2/PF14608_6/0_033zfCCCH_2/PF14608_6/5